MQATLASSDKIDKSDKSLINDDNSLDNNDVLIDNDKTYDYGNIKIPNYTETPDIEFNKNNDPPDFSTMSQRNWVAYIVDVTRMARFLLFADVVIA